MNENQINDGKIAMMIKLIETEFSMPKEELAILIKYLRDMFETIEQFRRTNESK